MFDVRELVEDVAELVAETAHSNNWELATQIAVGMPTNHRGDSARLRQVLTNLIGNALKFTAAGEVVVRVSRIGEIDQRAVLRIEVKDTGIGILEEAQTRIFDSFAQADGSTERKFGGTGWGLTISAQLVELMGGEIGVQSTPGQGTTFWFTACLGQVESHETSTDDVCALASSRVLAVDDNQTNRETLTEHLQSWGMEHDCAGDAEGALKLLRRAVAQGRPYALVLLDRHLPGMDGIDLSRAIAALPEFNNHTPSCSVRCATHSAPMTSMQQSSIPTWPNPCATTSFTAVLRAPSAANH